MIAEYTAEYVCEVSYVLLVRVLVNFSLIKNWHQISKELIV